MKRETSELIARITAVADQYRRRLMDIEDTAERQLVNIFSEAEGGILDRIPRMLRERRINVDQGTAWLADTERMLDRVLIEGGRKWVDSQFSLATEWALDRTKNIVLAGGKLRNVRLIDDDVIRSSLLNFTDADDALLRSGLRRGYSLVRGIDRELGDHLRSVITRNVALGVDTNTIAEEIMAGGRLRPIGRISLEQRAQMIARTELARVAEDAAAAKSEQVGIKHFRWSAMVGDPRTADDSIRRHGRIKTRQQWLDYSPDEFKGVPPIRPHDRCTLVPIERDWLDDEEARHEFDSAISNDGRLLVSNDDRLAIQEFEVAEQEKQRKKLDK